MSRMPEAEVSLRLAFWLLEQGHSEGPIEVAIDGAQVRTGEVTHFDLPAFLEGHGWRKSWASAAWQCDYDRDGCRGEIRVHSNPGRGDVVARLRSGRTLRVECKKGPLVRSPGSQEYPLMREALGQLLTVREIGETDVLAIAVPHSAKFAELAGRWREAPLVRRLGILILTVDREGSVFGLTDGSINSSSHFIQNKGD